MPKPRAFKTDRLPEIAGDLFFLLWLTLEFVLRHTPAAQLAMACFCVSALALAWKRRAATGSYWFLFLGLWLLYCLIGTAWSADAALTLRKCKTLLVNLAFLLCAYQYLTLRGDFRAVFRLIVAAAFLVAAYVLAVSGAEAVFGDTFGTDTSLLRFGNAANINPNDIAILAAFSALLCLAMALWEQRPRLLWLLPVLPLALVIFLTGSLKGYALLGGGGVLFLLLRFPKRWPLKLAALLALAAGLLWLFTAEGIMSHIPFIYYRITYKLQGLLASITEGLSGQSQLSSATERGGLIELGLSLFRQRPFSGFGLDTFQTFPGSGGTYSHNNYVELLASGGVPLLALYYAPYLLLIASAFRRAGRSRAVQAVLPAVCALLLLDFAMVSYDDRFTQLLPLLLLAAVRLAKDGAPNDFPKILAYVKNPFRIFAKLSSAGRLKWMPDRLYLRLVYRGCLGKKLDLKHPAGMTEKLQWQKLYDHNPLYTQLSDKLAVRDYVKARIGEEHLIPLLGAYGSAEDADFSALPDRFVLKCTHDSGGVLICPDKAAFDPEAARRWLKKRLAFDYYSTGREWAYKNIVPRAMAEAFIGGADGSLPDDYKIFCFDGTPRAVLYCTNRVKAHADYYFFTPDWELFPVNDVTASAKARGVRVEKPARLPEMLKIAEKLSAELPQVRVDLYDANGTVLFGELTLYDQSGFADDYVDGGDRIMGAFMTNI